MCVQPKSRDGRCLKCLPYKPEGLSWITSTRGRALSVGAQVVGRDGRSAGVHGEAPPPTRKLCLQCKEKGWVRGMGRTQSRKKLALRWGWPFHSSLARRIISSLQMRVKISPGRICKEHTHLHVQRTKHSSWSVFVHSISTPFPRNCGMNTQATL